jgi:serine/threonine-protein kinase
MQLPEQHPDEQGALEETSPIRLLARRAVAQQTGLLVMDCQGIAKQIFLVRGSPEFVASNVARELFGEYLKQHNIISSSELSMALAMMPHFGGKLGDTLVGLGLLRPLEVFRHLTRQVREKLIDVCTWQSGTYRWYDGYVNPKESFPLGLDAFEVLGAGSTALDAALCMAWAGERANRRPTVAGGRPRIAPEQFRLGPAPRDLLQKLTGRKGIRELVQNYDREDDRQAFLRTLILVVETELVNLV